MRGHAISYSEAELAWLEANHALPIGEYAARFIERFGRAELSPANIHALRKRKGWRTGRTGRYEPGATPANKGIRCPDGKGGRHPNARRTQFATGCRTGKAALNYKPIGSERLHKGGYVQRKIHDGMPMQSRWRFVHLINWEAIHGPLPSGYALKCVDGDRQNTAAENWELVSRGVLARLNGGRHKTRLAFDDASPELKPTLMAVARLEQRAHELRKPSADKR